MNYLNALVITIVCSIVLGYTFGSILFAVVIGKLLKLKNIRELGSKNPGFTNSQRVYGKQIAFLVLLLDIIKTIIPIMICFILYRVCFYDIFQTNITNYFNPAVLIYLPGIFVVIGHIWPMFHKFKGGKGVACYGAFCICVSPFIALVGIIIILIVIKIKKVMSIGTLLATGILPFLTLIPGLMYMYLVYPNLIECTQLVFNNLVIVLPITGMFLLCSILVFYKHKENIKSIRNNSEITLQKI